MIHFRPLWGLTIASFICLCILLSLGGWQVQRLHWKTNLIAQVNRQIAAPPVPFSVLWSPGADMKSVLYRPVTVTGRFDHAHELHLFAQDEDGLPGYRVITPLIGNLNGGREGAVLVDRGLVPQALKDQKTRADGLVAGEVTVTGILRALPRKGPFTPANDMAANIWFSLTDPAQIAKATGRTDLPPVLIAADLNPTPGLWPHGSPRQVTFRNAHLGYAITWFGLALSLVGVYFAYHINKGRLRMGTSSGTGKL